MFDLQATEATLFSLVRGDIESFAAAHRDERFYGVFLDCNSYYGDVLVHLNTPALHRNHAEKCKVQSNLWADKTMDEVAEELRWSPGDWGHFEINRSDEWQEHWEPVRREIEAVRDEVDSFEEQFMSMACRVLIRIEESGVLDLLSRTPDFAAMCADHDEPIEDSRDRLRLIREQ